MKLLEHKEQTTLLHWWLLAHRSFCLPEAVLFAIPNGGARSVTTGALLKAEGVRAGVPDLFLAVSRGGFYGLFIEMKKAKGGIVSSAQHEMCDILQAQGYACKICHGWIAAKDAIELYLNAAKV